MTHTVNGIGTHLSGERLLTDEEIKEWAEQIPYNPRRTLRDYRIATESFVVVFLPIIPLRTFVFHYTGQDQYVIDFFPTGKESVYWKHVKSSPGFYILPILIVLFTLYSIFSSFFGRA
jgi:hypothetical protein